MGYRVQEVSRDDATLKQLAEFLAHFVQDGELPEPKTGDDQADVWRTRFSWWWKENPFCREDSPLGFILYANEDEIVGFSGYIPADYVVEGEVVPSLMATTFFVREAHRSAVMGLLTRQRALGRRYHIIDGSPSPEMRRLLGKLGYQHAGERFQYFFPLNGFGSFATQAILEKAGLSFHLPEGSSLSDTHYLATCPAEVETIPSFGDSKIHRQVTHESLKWLCQVGSSERSFFGWCDARGELIAYAVGIYKRHLGLCVCLLLDYVDFRPDKDGMGQLIRRIMEDPIGSGLARDTDALAISTLGKEEKPGQRGLRRDSILYYHLPNELDSRSKACLPIEGDLAFI